MEAETPKFYEEKLIIVLRRIKNSGNKAVYVRKRKELERKLAKVYFIYNLENVGNRTFKSKL